MDFLLASIPACFADLFNNLLLLSEYVFYKVKHDRVKSMSCQSYQLIFKLKYLNYGHPPR